MVCISESVPEPTVEWVFCDSQSDRYDVRTALVTFSNIVDIILYVQVITMLTRNMPF